MATLSCAWCTPAFRTTCAMAMRRDGTTTCRGCSSPRPVSLRVRIRGLSASGLDRRLYPLARACAALPGPEGPCVEVDVDGGDLPVPNVGPPADLRRAH